MRWFKHFNDMRRNPKLLAIEREVGEAGYARTVKLLEIVASLTETGDKFEIHLESATTNEEWLSQELNIKRVDLTKTCAVLARVNFIDADAWKMKIISIPQMALYRDEWTRKQKKQKHSRETTEKLRSDSEATPEQSTEVEVRGKRTELETEVVRRTPRGRRTAQPSPRPVSKAERQEKKVVGLIEKIKADDETIGSFVDSLKRDGSEHPEWLRTADAARKFCGYKIDVDDPTVSVSFVSTLARVFEKHQVTIDAGDMLRSIFCSKTIDQCRDEGSMYPPSFGRHRDKLREEERAAQRPPVRPDATEIKSIP
ncbi:MAG: hypothetical protein ACRD8A_15450 [Candidatus Acidiferrales bacterium]